MGSVAPVIFMIRHGEKPKKEHHQNDDPIGLSEDGLTRAEALVEVFGKASPYNIRCILAEKPQSNGERDRPWLTVTPLAESLKGDVLVNHFIDRDDAESVTAAARAYRGDGNILICWEHHALTDIAAAFGIPSQTDEDKENITYPDDRFDQIWTLLPPYNRINEKSSEHTILDEKYKNDA